MLKPKSLPGKSHQFNMFFLINSKIVTGEMRQEYHIAWALGGQGVGSECSLVLLPDHKP